MTCRLPALTAGLLSLVALLPTARANDLLVDEESLIEDFTDDLEDLAELDLEDLLDIECTVVSRRVESLDRAPAAVYVVTGEEIRRAGHSTIQEALRMVPGTFVSQWRTSDWDVTIRGFGPGLSDVNSAYLNQVLVMIDGVVVYTPLYAGTWWGLLDIDMEHVDRIEVIRGPSGILWGANAFHGLVNVVMKDSAENEGQRLSVRVSNDNSFVTLRSTGVVGDGVGYSAWARRSRFDSFADRGGYVSEEANHWFDRGIDSGGLRLDGVTDAGWLWRLEGRGYEAEAGRVFDLGGGSYLTGEDHQYGGQLSYTLTDPGRGIEIRTAYVKDKQTLFDTLSDIDIDHLQFEARRTHDLEDGHSLQYGVGYDLIHSNTDLYGGFAVDTLRQNNVRAFVSDTWTVPETDLALSVGVQAIQHEFSGFDVQPSLRFAWTPHPYSTWWGSVSRAVRTPSIEEEVFGQGTFDTAETVVAFELGWRGEVVDGLNLDVAAYFNDYDDVRMRRFDPVTSLDTYRSDGAGYARGVEIAFDVKPRPWWTVRGSWSGHLSDHNPDGEDAELDFVDSQYPVHMANLRNYFDLGDDWELDVAGYLVERFDRADGTDGAEYWRGDVRLGWQATEDLRLGFGVQGFNDSLRSEYGRYEARRLFYVTLDLLR